MKILAFIAYLATIPAANWMIVNVGTQCIPDGPCLIPVLPGLMAPSGVLMIGAALVLRDVVQNLMGVRGALFAVLCGTLLSLVFAPPSLVAASALAFLVAELLDLAVYTPIRKRSLVLAVLASGFVGAIADSAMFLWVAFGSLEFIAGQVVGKLWMTIAAAIVLIVIAGFRKTNPAKEVT